MYLSITLTAHWHYITLPGIEFNKIVIQTGPMLLFMFDGISALTVSSYTPAVLSWVPAAKS